MANDFGTGKSILVLAIVAGCFSVFWPQVLFPMIQGLYSPKESITISKEHLKQEKPPHLRPELIHPALRERDRAIQKLNSDRLESLPGMRPPMGGAGRVVPPPKTTGATMGILMPMYIIGILVLFLYTIEYGWKYFSRIAVPVLKN